MIKTITAAIVTIILTQIAAPQTRAKIDDLAWIAGCWELKRPERQTVITEQWMAPAGGAMIGMGRTLRAGKMTEFEYVRIVDDGNSVNYIAKPSVNKEETPFKLVKWSAVEVVFENPAHDFPQRIMYRKQGDDRLDARIEGTMGGKSSGIDFPMQRTKCG